MTSMPLIPALSLDPHRETYQSLREALTGKGLALEINTVNWDGFGTQTAGGKSYPDTVLHLAHYGSGLALHFQVSELGSRAVFMADQEPVWRESCVELFIAPEDSTLGPRGYYNFECNALGTLLCQFGSQREDRTFLPQEVMGSIFRFPALGREPFAYREGVQTWSVALLIPATAFCMHRMPALDGQSFAMNAYKCADDLPNRHYVSWQKISTPQPDFHRPEYFGLIKCASF